MTTLARLTAALADRYRVERELGAGGMATVYLAHDLRHERDVAIKVLHPDLGAALGADRFLSEIKTTAKLQHPHILPLLDSGAADGLLYYVMPYVRGETLRARLEREKQLPIADAVRIAREVAGALDHAHKQGVIHRDIKPENILLQDGAAVVADFGIALAVQQAGGQRMTQTGLSLGTPQYMSPEQAMGERAIDARSDLYALGAVTYEMLAGDAPFLGSSVQAIVAKVLSEKPTPLRTVRDTVPAEVDAAVQVALAKLPADRFDSAASFAAALQRAPTERGTTRPTGRAGGGGRRVVLRSSGAVGALALVGGWLMGRASPPTGEPGAGATSRFEFTTAPRLEFAFPFSGVVASLALSPDGTLAAFSATYKEGMAIALRRRDQLAARVLPGTEGGRYPAFSPDGRWIAFESTLDGQIKKVAVDGGTLINLCEVKGLGTAGIGWLSNDAVMFSPRGVAGDGLYKVAATGGQATRFTRADAGGGERYLLSPVAVPGGRYVVYSATRASVTEIFLGLVDLRTGQGRSLKSLRATRALGVVAGMLVYIRPDGALMAAPFDGSSGTVGTPIQVGDSVATRQWDAAAALSASGALLYQEGGSASQLVLVDTMGNPRLLIDSVRAYAHPRFSPDGRLVAFDAGTAGGGTDLWTLEVGAQAFTRLTTTGTDDRPEWSPDGTRLVYASSRTFSLGTLRLDGSTKPQPVAGITGIAREGTFTPDGRRIVYRADTEQRNRDLLDVALDSAGVPTPRPLVATPADEKQPRVSPDGRWLAYVSSETGREEVYVRGLPDGSARVTVSSGGGGEPLWSRDGHTLYYRLNDRLMAATIGTSPVLVASDRRTLFRGPYASDIYHQNYDVTADGRGFLFVRPAAEYRRFIYVDNWVAELQARRATSR